MGTPKHEPTEEGRKLVELHSAIGTRQDVIASIMHIDPKTLRLHYRDELDHATAKANATIGGALFNKAKGGDTVAQIFWMKTRAGWHETNRTEITGADGGPVQTEDVSARERIAGKLARLAARGDTEGNTGEPE